MTLRPSIQIDAATRYCLDRQITFDKPVCLLDASLLRKLRLPGFFKPRKRKVKRLALTETRQAN
jgi:hypothetical protein